jgi:hypothetical protein
MGWLSRIALLAAALLVVPACGSSGGTKAPFPGSTSAIWQNTASTGPTQGTGVFWKDPNTAPIVNSGGTGDLFYGTVTQPWNGPVKYPAAPDSNRPVYLIAPQNSAEEYNIEGQAQGFRQAQAQGGGGGFFNNNQFGVNQLPPLYISYNLRNVARARCKDLSDGFQNALESLANRMIAAKLSFVAGTEQGFYATGADAGAAWTLMVTIGADQAALAGGWFGGGYWNSGVTPWWGLVFCDSNSTTGP